MKAPAVTTPPALRSPDAPAPIDAQSVTGWGEDADTSNDPTYPYRNRTHDDHSGVWKRPSVQAVEVEILQSVEHLRRPAVVGTSTPPSAISGAIRRAAFRWSESNLIHWMLLMGADRINVVEGLVQDLARGKIPNIPGEMGGRAELRLNKAGLAKKVGIAAGVLGAAVVARSVMNRQR